MGAGDPEVNADQDDSPDQSPVQSDICDERTVLLSSSDVFAPGKKTERADLAHRRADNMLTTIARELKDLASVMHRHARACWQMRWILRAGPTSVSGASINHCAR